MKAPIAIFAYRRASHLKSTVDALRQNEGAEQSDIHLFCDGSKGEQDRADVLAVQEYAKTIAEGFKSVTLHISESNRGLADSIVAGVTQLVEEYGRIIVVEDDIVTSPAFISYMNAALDAYEHTEKVFHISGYSFPMPESLPRVYLAQMPFVWGWATWKRAWKHYSHDAVSLVAMIEAMRGTAKFNYDAQFNFMSPLKRNAKGLMKTWAIRWQASIFCNRGLCVTASPSYTNNNGHDGSGEHYDTRDMYWNTTLATDVPEFPHLDTELPEGRAALTEFLLKMKPPLLQRIGAKLVSVFRS